MARGLVAAIRKDLLLLLRDRAGLVFLTIAPVIVITVAGLSLARLYGTDVLGASPDVLLLVDEDEGRIAGLVREKMETVEEFRLRPVEDRPRAVEEIHAEEATAALVIPAGTNDAIVEGRPAEIVLYTDPVKFLELANLRLLVQELRHTLEVASREKAGEHLADARLQALDAHAQFEGATSEFREKGERFRADLASMREEIVERMAEARKRAAEELDAAIESAATKRADRIRERLARELKPLPRFLSELRDRRRDFDEWLADAREKAGGTADELPAPPKLPAVPSSIESLAKTNANDLTERVVGISIKFQSLPRLPRVTVPALPAFPKLALPEIPEPPEARFPGTLEIREESVTGAPVRPNTFDQNVPGFSVTFLLLGMLFGVSLGLLDERDWGTLDRLRAMPAPFSATLVAKLFARFLVGMGQMALLFAVGWAAFGVSLGREPWALLLPTAGIVFAGTTFGLVVAGVAKSRESVLPVGSVVVVTMAAVGGCWWPIELEPDWMQDLALAFPTTWAMSAYNDLMIRRQSADAALVPTAVLFIYGTLYLLGGLVLFRRHTTRG